MTVTKRHNSVHLDASGAVATNAGKIERVIMSNATDVGLTVTLYDSPTGTTNKLTPAMAVDKLGGEDMHTYVFELGIEFTTGLWAVLVGAGGEATFVLARK